MRFGLQAADEPSLVVEARRGLAVPRPAARAGPPRRRARRRPSWPSWARPPGSTPSWTARCAPPGRTGLTLDTGGAHRFLARGAPALATAGFGVQLPGWWTKPSSRLGAAVTARRRRQPGRVARPAPASGFDAIAEFRYDLAVGGEVLDRRRAGRARRAEVADGPAARPVDRAGRPPAGGRPEAGRAHGRAERRRAAAARSRRSTPATPTTCRSSGVEADGWLGDLLSGRRRAAARAGRRARDASTAQLRPYQARGLAWLDFLGRVGLGGVLADDMGLGKTVQLLAAAGASRPAPGPDPAGLPDVAGRQLAARGGAVHPGRCACTSTTAPSGPAARRSPTAVAGCDLVVTTYALAARDAADLREIAWRAGGPRRGAGDQERRHQAGHGDPLDPGRDADRGDRHAGGEPARRPVVDPGVRQPRAARAGRDVQEALRRADRAARRRRRRRRGCAGSPGRSSCAGSRPTGRSSPTCRRSWRWRCSAT